MALRDAVSNLSLAAARAVKRASHGLLFVAGGALRSDGYRRRTARHFDTFMTDRADILQGLNPLEARVYARAVPRGARVCVIGCGTGRDLVPFAAAGHDVVGIDPAPAALETLAAVLRDQRLDAQLLTGFIEDVEPPGMFDAFVFSQHCYCYIRSSASRVAVLAKVAKHLNPQGVVAINYLRRLGPWSRTGVTLAAWTSRLTGSRLTWEPHDVVTLLEDAAGASLMYEHYFTTEEIQGEAGEAGLRHHFSDIDPFLGPISVFGR